MFFDKNLHEKKLSAQEMGGDFFWRKKKSAQEMGGDFFGLILEKNSAYT